MQSIETDATRKVKKEPPVPWLPHNVLSSRSLGDHHTTAQVHPGLLTKFLADQVFSTPSAELVIGCATALKQDGGAAKTVVVQTAEGEQEVEADCVVLAAGPWTGKLAMELLGKKVGGTLGVEGHRAHSIVLKTKEQLSAHCLFTSMRLEDDSAGEPEVYTRPDGTTYMWVLDHLGFSPISLSVHVPGMVVADGSDAARATTSPFLRPQRK